MLVIDLKIGESVQIGDGVSIALMKKSGQIARLAIKADGAPAIKRVPRAPSKEVAIAAHMGISGKVMPK